MRRTALAILIILISAGSAAAQYQLLDVDGIEVTIDEIRFARGYEDSETVASIAVGETVNLTGQLNDVFNASTTIRLEFGESNLSFDTINIQLVGGVGIKGHTYIESSDTHVYTAATGIKKVSAQGATWSAPSDYGYLRNDYIYHPGDEGEQLETTFMDSTVTFEDSEPLSIELLVDTFQVAYYWDGQDSTRHGFVQTWHWENSAYFPTGTEVIGISYLPLYLSVNRSLTAETYIVAESDVDLVPATGGYYDQKQTMTMTIVFDKVSGDFFIGRTANWDGLNISLSLPQFVTGATSSGATYDIVLTNYDNGWTTDTSIAGFGRLAVGGTGTATYTDETGSSMTMHYKRVK